MNSLSSKLTLVLLCIVLLLTGLWYFNSGNRLPEQHEFSLPDFLQEGEKSEKEERAERIRTKIARSEYFFRLLRDPETNTIPRDVRAKELKHARMLPNRSMVKMKLNNMQATSGFEWQAAGPFDVGGRTRALGIDLDNPNVIIAGGVSGGIWKSVNDGAGWMFQTQTIQNLSVTSLAQDPTDPDTWYYTSGEFTGNTAADRGFRAPYFGSGIFKSIDNGETWTRIAGSPSQSDLYTRFDSPYDFISRIVVSPISGSVFIASNGFGIFRSTDDGASFSHVLGTPAEQIYCDVAVVGDTLVATISEATFDQGATNNPGVFVSTNNGDDWTEITPSTFPSTHQRSVVAIAPSDPDIIYILTYVGGTEENEDVRFHIIDLSGGLVSTCQAGSLSPGTCEDRSENLPDFGPDVGYMSTQANYNMVVAVKPDSADFVLVGGINLFRSRDGFATRPAGGYDNSNQNQKDEYWIGGYANANDISKYPEQHPDQHVIVFDPSNPDRVWVGHDGGLSVTNDITAAPVTWESKNNGYVTTQFYTIDLPAGRDDNRLIGGAQDNGTLFFRSSSDESESFDISSGDGGYAYFTENYIFVSRQNGSIIRYNTTSTGNPTSPHAFVHPANAENQLFIHPYVLDPTNESVMYYSAGNVIWRNTRVDLIVNQNSDGAGLASGWEKLTDISAPSGYIVSALEVSVSPPNILYYAASSDDATPNLYKLNNASSATDGEISISIDNATQGAYIHDIAVNPNNSDELLAVLSNYNVESIWHTLNGGVSWTSVEGNLSGNPPNSYGPSVRSATIIPAEEGTIYAAGTSTGLYTTTRIDGSETQWVQEAADEIGYAVTEYVTSRTSDGLLAAGTHGRGVFLGTFTGVPVGTEPAEQFALQPGFPNPTGSVINIRFDLPVRSLVTITLYDIQGRKIAEVVSNQERPAFKGLVEPVNLQALNLASGIYLYRLEAEPLEGDAGTFSDTGKITYVK